MRGPQPPFAGENLDGDLLDELLTQLRADADDAREAADRATRRAVANEEMILMLLDGVPAVPRHVDETVTVADRA